MRCEQIAIYVHSEKQADSIKDFLGLGNEEWIEDEPVGNAVVRGVETELKAKLRFNYQFFSVMEFELITCLTNVHAYTDYPQYAVGKPFLCHFGYHVEEWPEINAPLVQEMVTHTHTNPYVLETGRHYHYKIYDTRDQIGTFTKFIQR